MTHTDQLRRALRAYDLAGPETPERAAAMAAVLSAAHGVRDDEDNERTAFENMQNRLGVSTKKNAAGVYMNKGTRSAWFGWAAHVYLTKLLGGDNDQ
jgi:hypothetical protein